ncbi:M48 family metalloprotease [Leptospira sp. 2 VSF19]|uniref:M48 family metalloprotease n=1 Tax=Leptospira soteropolitanensis TaxID=2950025 RepID=A0AAW5VHZ9_9LEPT|nr:M48 family metalloprotease [Leptospira soteropolitanensis]MCW7492386.1 M48 family metalloprotease [Leptospira soteropolitanensis]MCW7499966.1 M48 family metalloprotease [Leptospira soteropolitanensis]MCW7522218.1 M48 family metalloprotease [Leptospira soteropolitanensis]MCW7526073.1 M48 family metalloprotease [Leptospira soteropolitanensis]MCW7529815.1 M48 family metalloprotease [Leptospira soteropolitanensis]
MRALSHFFLILIFAHSVLSKGNVYVQSTKAKLLSQPKLNADGSPLQMGESLSPVSEQGLFVQVRAEGKMGWVSKLFVSPLPPGNQIKLGVTSNSSEAVVARQRASDFTKTAAARGLSETQKMRVRGEGDLYDFESLRWLESVPFDTENTNTNGGFTKFENSNIRNFFFSNSEPEVLKETKAEVKLGRSLAARLLKKYTLVKDEELTGYLNGITSQLAAVSSRRDLNFRVGVIESSEINAFACPGGYIFLTTGSLKKIHSEAELAGIIGHEMGHIVLFHNGEFQGSNELIDVISSLLAPPGTEVINAATSSLLDEMEKQLFETGRDMKLELEADEAAVGLTSQAGFSPVGLSSYLNTLSKSEGTDSFKKTHPDTTVRIAKLVFFESSTSAESRVNVKDRWQEFKSKLKP